MDKLIVHDIGDGCHVDIYDDLYALKIDFGRSDVKKIEVDSFFHNYWWYKINAFLLSHFHNDHYNGLYAMIGPSSCRRVDIEVVYFPHQPVFNNSKIFFKQLAFLNRISMGDHSKSPQYDLIRLISSINNRDTFKYRALSQGDKFYLSNNEIEVLWPPSTIQNKRFVASVEKVISKFDETLEKFPDLKRLYIQFNQNENSLDSEGTIHTDEIEKIEEILEDRKILNSYTDTQLKDISDLNTDFRGIANRISLALKCGGNLLFMGDLESGEINKVIKYLKSKHTFNHCNIMITPHHGTNWGAKLMDIFIFHSISSNGREMIKYFKEDYKKISLTTHSTFLEGDIVYDFEE